MLFLFTLKLANILIEIKMQKNLNRDKQIECFIYKFYLKNKILTTYFIPYYNKRKCMLNEKTVIH